MKKISFVAAAVVSAISLQANATSIEVYGDENDVIGMYGDYNFGEDGQHYVTGEVTNDSFVELGYGYSINENFDLGASYVQGGYGGADEVRVKASTAYTLGSSLTLSGGVEYHHGLDKVGADFWAPTSGGKGDGQGVNPDGHDGILPAPGPHDGVLPAAANHDGTLPAPQFPDHGIDPHVLPDIGIQNLSLADGNNESQVVKVNLGLDYNIAKTVVLSYDLDAYSQLAEGIYVDGEEVDSEWSTSTLKATYVNSGEVQPYVKVAADNSDIEDTTFTAGVVIAL
ncbi:hypothetical protein KI743_14170 [Vibrio sp. D420a]|uniref:hypothetical protein n=1 Tax=Vibrio sp. D420a TaxID=2836895 RepID=UPI002552F529|nr:hypothetical protein [Vibrio sp. D420a]MDK9763149.1 hypothetical protein [Vibrio sp. D420a]